MPCLNPTGDSEAIRLSIPAGNMPFLWRVLGALVEGITDDLENHRKGLRLPQTMLLIEQRAYAMLLDALGTGRAVPTPAMILALTRLAEVIDAGNEYRRVVFEHDALYELLAQLEGQASS